VKIIKYIVGVFFLGMLVAGIPDILVNLPLVFKENVHGAIGHVLLGLFLSVIFGFIGFKFIKSAQKEKE